MIVLSAQIDSLAYGKDSPIFEEVALDVRGGERVALVGPNGSGKSTLLRVLAGWSDSIDGLVVRGRTRLGGTDFAHPSDGTAWRSAVRSEVTYMGPRLQEESLGVTVGEEVDQVRLQWGDRALPLDDASFLDELAANEADTPMAHLARGRAQRLAIIDAVGRAIRHGTALFLDEPTRFVDDKSLASLLDLLEFAQRQEGCAVLLATNDERLVGTKDRRVELPGHQGGQDLLWSPLVDEVGRAVMEDVPVVSVALEGSPLGRAGPLPIRYDLTVEGDRTTLLRGPNGSGKTTLLWTIAHLNAFRGRRRVSDGRGRRLAGRGLQPRHLGIVFQEPEDYEFRSKVAALIEPPPWLPSGLGEAWVTYTREVCRGRGFAIDRDPRTLSTGQLRLAWLLGLIPWARLWLLDELEAGLDGPARRFVGTVLRSHVSVGGGVVAASHRPLLYEGLDGVETISLKGKA